LPITGDEGCVVNTQRTARLARNCAETQMLSELINWLSIFSGRLMLERAIAEGHSVCPFVRLYPSVTLSTHP